MKIDYSSRTKGTNEDCDIATCAGGPANQRRNSAHEAAYPRVHYADPLQDGSRHSHLYHDKTLKSEP